MSMTVKQHLWFAKDMEKALRFYTSLIPGSAIDFITPIPADTPSGPEGSARVAAFTLGDQRYMAVEAGPLDVPNHSFSIIVECDTQGELDRIYAALLEGGTAEPCGWLVDRYGFSWQITPKRLGELMQSPDKAVAKRVTEAMLRMKKFDIAALEQAARG